MIEIMIEIVIELKSTNLRAVSTSSVPVLVKWPLLGGGLIEPCDPGIRTVLQVNVSITDPELHQAACRSRA